VHLLPVLPSTFCVLVKAVCEPTAPKPNEMQRTPLGICVLYDGVHPLHSCYSSQQVVGAGAISLGNEVAVLNGQWAIATSRSHRSSDQGCNAKIESCR
jgi:hypothetical protein